MKLYLIALLGVILLTFTGCGNKEEKIKSLTDLQTKVVSSETAIKAMTSKYSVDTLNVITDNEFSVASKMLKVLSADMPNRIAKATSGDEADTDMQIIQTNNDIANIGKHTVLVFEKVKAFEALDKLSPEQLAAKLKDNSISDTELETLTAKSAKFKNKSELLNQYLDSLVQMKAASDVLKSSITSATAPSVNDTIALMQMSNIKSTFNTTKDSLVKTLAELNDGYVKVVSNPHIKTDYYLFYLLLDYDDEPIYDSDSDIKSEKVSENEYRSATTDTLGRVAGSYVYIASKDMQNSFFLTESTIKNGDRSTMVTKELEVSEEAYKQFLKMMGETGSTTLYSEVKLPGEFDFEKNTVPYPTQWGPTYGNEHNPNYSHNGGFDLTPYLVGYMIGNMNSNSYGYMAPSAYYDRHGYTGYATRYNDSSYKQYAYTGKTGGSKQAWKSYKDRMSTAKADVAKSTVTKSTPVDTKAVKPTNIKTTMKVNGTQFKSFATPKALPPIPTKSAGFTGDKVAVSQKFKSGAVSFKSFAKPNISSGAISKVSSQISSRGGFGGGRSGSSGG